jgi:hypothetical protein
MIRVTRLGEFLHMYSGLSLGYGFLKSKSFEKKISRENGRKL